MQAKTMEGLLGARINMDMTATPMRVFKEARRKGDTATMERAMGYVNEFSDTAEQYKAEADEGMKEDAKEAREQAEKEREESMEKRRLEREKTEEKTAERRETDGQSVQERQDRVEISEEGRTLLREEAGAASAAEGTTGADAPAVGEPVLYTSAGVADVETEGGKSAIKGKQVNCYI